MKNIDEIKPFKSTIKKTDFGILTSLVTRVGISTHKSISYEGKTLLANSVDRIKDDYDLVYTVVDNQGNHQNFREDDGVLPTLFFSPNQENYVSIIPYHQDKELEISIPLFNRENTELPKGKRPFVGDFIGASNQYSIFIHRDSWASNDFDKLLVVEFKNGVIKKQQNIKIPLPKYNKIFIANNEIHLLAINETGYLHRQIDEKGNVIKQREIKSKEKNLDQILSLSFDKESYLLSRNGGVIAIEKVDLNDSIQTIELFDIGESFYSTTRPVKIADDTYVISFVNSFGNGWFRIKKDQLLEIFYNKNGKGYIDLLNNKPLEMKHKDLIISSINKTTENAYAIVFYPRTDDNTNNKEILILNHQITG